jgi:steroid delta-isomerase-like uncharacterized protein
MSAEENKAIVKRWNEEIWNRRNVDIIDDLADASYVNRVDNSDREGYKRFAAAVLAAFSEGGISVDDVIAEGDKVAIRWTMHSIHTGEYTGIPPTGRSVTISGMSIYRIADGKVVEDWSNYDGLGMMQQLGVIPPMGEDGE